MKLKLISTLLVSLSLSACNVMDKKREQMEKIGIYRMHEVIEEVLAQEVNQEIGIYKTMAYHLILKVISLVKAINLSCLKAVMADGWEYKNYEPIGKNINCLSE